MSYEIFKQMKSQIEKEEENDGINLGQPIQQEENKKKEGCC